MVSEVKKVDLNMRHKLLLLKEEARSVVGQTINEVLDTFFENCKEVAAVSWIHRIEFVDGKDVVKISRFSFHPTVPTHNNLMFAETLQMDPLPWATREACDHVQEFIEYIKDYLPVTIGERRVVIASRDGVVV